MADRFLIGAAAFATFVAAAYAAEWAVTPDPAHHALTTCIEDVVGDIPGSSPLLPAFADKAAADIVRMRNDGTLDAFIETTLADRRIESTEEYDLLRIAKCARAFLDEAA
jgi:hypothetical protein